MYSNENTINTKPFSSITGINCPISIAFPSGYQENTDKRFQVVYATGGQWSFGGYSNIIAKSGKQLL